MPIPGFLVGEHTAGDELAEQVIHEERIRIDQATALACGDVLAEAVFQEPGFACAAEANDM
jgi:hypothetical protein